MSTIAATTYPETFTVTPSDTTDDPHGVFAGLYVLANGTLSFLDGNGNAVVVTGTLTAGQVVPITCKRVKSTGTSATVLGLKAFPWKGK